MSRVLVAGVDTSTQSCKVRVTDAATGELVRFGQAKHPDGSTVNPEHWWRAFQEAASQAGGLDDVSAIAVGGRTGPGDPRRDAVERHELGAAGRSAHR